MSVSKIDVALPSFTYFKTARFRIIRPTSLSKLTRCVLGSGIQTSFINTSIIDDLKLAVIDQQNLAVRAFESSSVGSSPRRLFRLDPRAIWTNSSTTITAFESAYEFLPQPTMPRNINMMTHTPKLQFADPREQDELPVEIAVHSATAFKVRMDA
jgi:hypothetical protein